MVDGDARDGGRADGEGSRLGGGPSLVSLSTRRQPDARPTPARAPPSVRGLFLLAPPHQGIECLPNVCPPPRCSTCSSPAAMGRLTLEQVSQESKGGADATTSLNLSHRILSDVSCLSNFHNLERLDLSFNCLSSLEDLSSCVNLKWLSVMENKLETLKGVEGLSKLTILNAGKNMLRAMDEIKSLTSLRALILNDNKIPSICKLDHLSFLNTLGSTSMPKILNRLPSSLGKSRSTIIGHNAYNWNIILRGFLEGNAPNKVILAYALMRRKRVKVDSFTILFVIKACGVIMQKVLGKQVHAQVTKLGFQQEVVTQTAILQMYGLFGDIEAADKLFGETSKRDIVQWNALLAMYSQRNRPYSTIKVAQRMVSESVRPNEVTVVSIISACSHLKALAEGK